MGLNCKQCRDQEKRGHYYNTRKEKKRKEKKRKEKKRKYFRKRGKNCCCLQLNGYEAEE